MAKTMRLVLFWTQDALNKVPQAGFPAAAVAQRYVEDATTLFRQYGIEVKTWPETVGPEGGMILPYPSTINLPEHDLYVRRMAHARYPNGRGVPVIFATLNERSRVELNKEGEPLEVLGWVPDEPVVTHEWLNFVFINLMRCSTIGYTLAHELGHAAGLEHEPDDKANVMYPGAYFSTNKFTPAQIETIRNAYFVEDS